MKKDRNMSRKELSLFLFLCLSALAIHAQQTQVIEKYMSKFEEGFEFDPGLYTSLEDWKNNEPSIPIYWIIGYEPDGSDPKTFLSQEMKKKSAILDEKQAEAMYRERMEKRMKELDNLER